VNRSRIAWLLGLACVLATAVASILDKVGAASRPADIEAGVGAGIVTLAAGVISGQLTNAINRRVDFSEQLTKGIFMPGGRLPLVKQVSDPIPIGVHPAPLHKAAAGLPADQVPAYVSRDRDASLREALRESAFTLLVGDAAAGKSRAAFEAMQAVLPRHVLIAPSTAQDVAAAAAAARTLRKCVLWLDDLQVFLGDGGITRKDVAEVLAGTGHHRVILATMRAIDESRLTDGSGEPGGILMRVGQTVTEQARYRFYIERLFSATEKERAQELAGRDPRIADALGHADRNGVGEYLAWGPQLFNQWQDAWTRGNRPRGAALVAAAVDCRRAGFTGPLPRPLLEDLHTGYLDRRGGITLSPERLELAWDWALKLRESGSAPLQLLGDDRYDVFDYLVDEFRRREGEIAPETAARAALRQAGPGDAGGIAATARRQGRYQLAEAALRQQLAAISAAADPDASEVLAVRNNLAIILQAQDRQTEAENEYRAILAGSADRSADRLDLLRVRNNLATVLQLQGRLADAAAEYRAVFDTLTGQPALGQAELLQVRNNLAAVLHAQGNLRQAEAEYRAVLAVRMQTVGAEDLSTLKTRNNHAVVLMDLRRFDEAEAEFRDVLAIRTRVLGPAHPHTVISKDNLSALLSRRSVGGEAER
jgi:eukaryotic-like serine/threonine-protein kinase